MTQLLCISKTRLPKTTVSCSLGFNRQTGKSNPPLIVHVHTRGYVRTCVNVCTCMCIHNIETESTPGKIISLWSSYPLFTVTKREILD